MAILSDCQEDQAPQKSFSCSFNAVLDPSNPLGFLESAFNFVSPKSNLFESDSAEEELMSLVRSIKGRIKAEEAEKKRLKEVEASVKKAAEKEPEEKLKKHPLTKATASTWRIIHGVSRRSSMGSCTSP